VSAGQLRFGVAVVGEDGAVPADPAVPTHLVCRPHGACVLEVVLERLDSRSVAVANVASSDLAFYLENVEMSAEDRALLERVVSLQRELAEVERALQAAQARIDAIFREQERIRANLATLPRDSDLYRRYVADLDAQEDELTALRAELERQRAERDELRRRLDELVAGLGR
jgi:chromosome segregation ATPase